MAKKRKKNNNKMRHWAVRAAVWTVPIAAGAVIGAYTVRWIDGIRAGHGGGGTEALPEGEPAELEASSQVVVNPLAIAAITPVIAAPVAVPYITPMAAPPLSPYPVYPEPGEPTPVVNPEPRRRTAAEVRVEREASFDEIVRRFEAGELDIG